MAEPFLSLPNQAAWRVLVSGATKAARAEGYLLSRMPGRGRSNVWEIERNGEKQAASVRTTRDRWIAFPPLNRGSRWKTLDAVDVVFVAAVDDRDDPRNVEVYLFDANDVRRRFTAAYAARTEAGLVVKDNFGMWVNLDLDKRGIPASVGSGLANEHKPIAVYPIEELLEVGSRPDQDSNAEMEATAHDDTEPPRRPVTIAEIMASARESIAEIAGVGVHAVRLELKIEY